MSQQLQIESVPAKLYCPKIFTSLLCSPSTINAMKMFGESFLVRGLYLMIRPGWPYLCVQAELQFWTLWVLIWASEGPFSQLGTLGPHRSFSGFFSHFGPQWVLFSVIHLVPHIWASVGPHLLAIWTTWIARSYPAGEKLHLDESDHNVWHSHDGEWWWQFWWW